MQLLILLVHALLAVALVAVVLIQQGKGAEAGAAFGGGASQTVFGSRGNSSFLAKLTGVLVALFFATALSLGWLAKHSGGGQQAASGIPNADMIEQQHRSSAPSLDDSNDGAAPAQDSNAQGDSGAQGGSSDGAELTAPSSDQPSADDADAQPSEAGTANSNSAQDNNAQ